MTSTYLTATTFLAFSAMCTSASQDIHVPKFVATQYGPILTIPAVEKDLALSPKQIGQIDETFARLDAERKAKAEKKHAALLHHEEVEAIKTILNKAQYTRFRQLELQQLPITIAFRQKDVTDRLLLTDEQRARMKKIIDKFGSEPPVRSSKSERKRLEQVQADLMAILTDKQKEKWAEMIGPKLDFGPR
jgi:hypothetical protein